MNVPNLDSEEHLRQWAAGHHEKCEARHKAAEDRHNSQQGTNTVLFRKIKVVAEAQHKTDRRIAWILGGVAVLSVVIQLLGAVGVVYLAKAAGG